MAIEKVLLVAIDFKKHNGWPASDLAQELKELVQTCRGEVVDSLICPVANPSPKYLIGEGKVNEIAAICSLNDIGTVIFSHDLKGSQQRNLEEIIKVKIIDRTQLILDIFARHAVSQEGKMQVELAQLEYLLPRLVGQGLMLSRLGGGIGTLGPGETKLEVDRRRISQRIFKLKKDLKNVAQAREVKKQKRKKQELPMISLVGYTNAGKSTLLNTLTQAGQITRDGLFTTLDSLARQYTLLNNQKVILSDTVGFMYELPHHLIEAFKATLEEVKEADLLLHVVDVSHSRFRYLYEAVLDILRQLEARDKQMIIVFNKIDLLDDHSWLNDLIKSFDHAVCVSALTGENIVQLNDKIIELLALRIVKIDVKTPLNRMDLVNLIYQEGQVHSIEYTTTFVHILASVPINIARKFD